MKDRQELLRRLDHYAECMDNGVHVTGSQMRKLVLDIREIGLLHMAPPSAPVGVWDLPGKWRAEVEAAEPGVEKSYLSDYWLAHLHVAEELEEALAQQPAAVDGVKCPRDGGSPCVEPMPAGMVYPKKPAPRAGGYLDTSGVEWNAWDAGQMEAYARAAYSDGWEAGYRAALAQQPATVDEAMVERATMALLGKTHDSAPGVDWRCDRSWTVNRVRELMRLALSAALAGQQDTKS